MRRELAGSRRLQEEIAFQPAALSLQDTPAHPLPRVTALSLCLLFALAILWAYFGRTEIVATAPGRLVVDERTKTLQPLEAGTVKRILVKDGDYVNAGQVLIELDGTAAFADHATVGEQLAVARSESTRATLLFDALTSSRPRLGSLDALPSVEHAQLLAEWRDTLAKLAKLNAATVHRRAELETVQATVERLEATLPLARQREADFQELVTKGFVSSHSGQDRTRERIELERDLRTQEARRQEAKAALSESDAAEVAFTTDMRRILSERLAQASLKIEQLAQEQRKTDQKRQLTKLVAPASGVVQQVAVHTEGGVVTPAQVLLVVVPKNASVTAEVLLDNKDVGFVREGQITAIKLETFPFTRYGTLPATVVRVSGDAISDEKRGAVFPVTISLERNSLMVDGKRVSLTPGMNLSAEITTGKRRVIEFLLSPVKSHLQESWRER